MTVAEFLYALIIGVWLQLFILVYNVAESSFFILKLLV